MPRVGKLMLKYARRLIQGPWPPGEEAIAIDHRTAREYSELLANLQKGENQ